MPSDETRVNGEDLGLDLTRAILWEIITANPSELTIKVLFIMPELVSYDRTSLDIVKFSIETDDHEIYGTGYRRAAMAYSKIGIEALMSHVVLYQDFPEI